MNHRGQRTEVTVIGAGVAGLACALTLAERGARVQVLERTARLGAGACSWQAGAMLAPWCERERAEALVAQLGATGIEWWRRRFPGTVQAGSLVLAHGREAGELARFSRRTEAFEWLDGPALAALEPALAGRFERALYFPGEAHLDPRAALAALIEGLQEREVPVRFGVEVAAGAEARGAAGKDSAGAQDSHAQVVDCRGLAAREVLSDLRGVRGEMLLLRSRELTLHRPVRMLHPRFPVYVVPREDGVFMVGATLIESEAACGVTARSALELLGAACALHPAFGEAEIIETGAARRPAFPDNLPRIRRIGRTWYVNGFYRHGFLLAPALAEGLADLLLDGRPFPAIYEEPTHENPAERRLA